MLKTKSTLKLSKKKKVRPSKHCSVKTCLKVSDIAIILGISRARAYELVNSDGFPRIVMGKRLIIPRQAFMDWIDANTVTKNPRV